MKILASLAVCVSFLGFSWQTEGHLGRLVLIFIDLYKIGESTCRHDVLALMLCRLIKSVWYEKLKTRTDQKSSQVEKRNEKIPKKKG